MMHAISAIIKLAPARCFEYVTDDECIISQEDVRHNADVLEGGGGEKEKKKTQNNMLLHHSQV